MTGTQFLLLFIAIIPIIGILNVFLVGKYPAFSTKVIFLLSIIFLINVIGLLSGYLNYNRDSLTLFSMNRDIEIGFSVDRISLMFLILIGLVWSGINSYCNKYFILTGDNRIFQFQIFSMISIEFIVLIILSKNIVTIFLFYQALIFCIYFFNTYFLHKSDAKGSHNFTLILLLSSFLFFLATIFTYKLTGQVDFNPNGIMNDGISLYEYALLLFLYLTGIATIAFVPIYFLYANLYYLSAPIMIIVFVTSYGLVSLFILIRVIAYIFGVPLFLEYNDQIGFGDIVSFILALNLLVSGLFAIFASNLKKSLIYLFFNQLILVIFSIFIFKQFIYHLTVASIAFILGQIVIFFSIGNINLYLLRSEKKVLDGIFYNLRITTIFLVFGLAGVIGISPSIALTAKYLMIKQSISNHSLINILIILMNMSLSLVCVVKILKPMFNKVSQANNQDLEVAKSIESDFGLMFPLILISSAMFVFFFFPFFISNFVEEIF